MYGFKLYVVIGVNHPYFEMFNKFANIFKLKIKIHHFVTN